jgi:hypothetical protein
LDAAAVGSDFAVPVEGGHEVMRTNGYDFQFEHPEQAFRRGMQQGAHRIYKALEQAGVLDAQTLKRIRHYYGIVLFDWRYAKKRRLGRRLNVDDAPWLVLPKADVPVQQNTWGIIRYAPMSGAFCDEDAAGFDGWYAAREEALAVAKHWATQYRGWVVALVANLVRQWRLLRCARPAADRA